VSQEKKSMYQILGVEPKAPIADIKAAHRRLSFRLLSGKSGLSLDERDYQLKLLDAALETLSDVDKRAAYDARLPQPAAPDARLPVPVANPIANPADESRALRLAEAVEHDFKLAAGNERKMQFQAITSTLGTSARALKTILRIVVGLIVLFMVMRWGQMAMASRTPPPPPSAEVLKAEEKLIIQKYYKTHGVRLGSRAEAEQLTLEHRRKENAQREAEFERDRAARELERFAEQGRSIGEEVSRDLRVAEAEARAEDLRRKRELQEEQERHDERLRGAKSSTSRESEDQ
jgi:curved DNA-binding protein CbpA